MEPKYTNIALEKIRVYYQSLKHTVEYTSPLESKEYDTVYCSSIFDFSEKKYIHPDWIRGGTGFFEYNNDAMTYTIPKGVELELPKEIDVVEPHINKGFTTRGCNNRCPPCVVHFKEGCFKIVGDIYTLWDGNAKLVICYDNNILENPEHFEHNAKIAIKHKIKLDYNQGLDHKKLTPEIVDVMKVMPHKEYHFAFDKPQYINSVEKAINLLQSKGIMRCDWYVLCGYDTDQKEDLFRLNYLRERNQNAYVQRYQTKENKENPYYISLARWVNQHHIFQGMTWEQFLKHPSNKTHRYLLGGN